MEINSTEKLATTEVTKELAITETKQLTSTNREKLSRLEAEIKSYLTKSTESIIEVGNRLIEAKELVEHGKWQEWLENNFQLKRQSAQNLMNIAKRFGGKFKDEANYRSIGNLNSTQMITMLALPEGQEEDFIEQKITDGTPVEKMSIRNLKTEIKQWNTTHKKQKNKNQNKNTIKAEATISSNSLQYFKPQPADDKNYLLLEQFLNLSNDLANIPNLNELAKKYTENNPDKFANEIKYLYSIIDTISPKQSK